MGADRLPACSLGPSSRAQPTRASPTHRPTGKETTVGCCKRLSLGWFVTQRKLTNTRQYYYIDCCYHLVCQRRSRGSERSGRAPEVAQLAGGSLRVRPSPASELCSVTTSPNTHCLQLQRQARPSLLALGPALPLQECPLGHPPCLSYATSSRKPSLSALALPHVLLCPSGRAIHFLHWRRVPRAVHSRRSLDVAGRLFTTESAGRVAEPSPPG